MAEKSVVITYETLFELLNREKEKTDLQKLEPSFFGDVIEYLKEKKGYVEETKNNASISYDERIKAEREMNNLYRIIKELYERREKKILLIALDKSRTKSNIIDTSSLLKEERAVFESLTKSLDVFRANILERVISQSQPIISEHQRVEQKQNHTEREFQSAMKSTKLVRFIHSVPKFVGTELEEYGPFQEEDVANLPKEIAELLMAKGRVEEIRED